MYVNHALLRSLILNANVLYIKQKLIDNPGSAVRSLASVSARYQTNRFIGIETGFEYGRTQPGKVPLGSKFNELRGTVSLTFRR